MLDWCIFGWVKFGIEFLKNVQIFWTFSHSINRWIMFSFFCSKYKVVFSNAFGWTICMCSHLFLLENEIFCIVYYYFLESSMREMYFSKLFPQGIFGRYWFQIDCPIILRFLFSFFIKYLYICVKFCFRDIISLCLCRYAIMSSW